MRQQGLWVRQQGLWIQRKANCQNLVSITRSQLLQGDTRMAHISRVLHGMTQLQARGGIWCNSQNAVNPRDLNSMYYLEHVHFVVIDHRACYSNDYDTVWAKGTD